MKLNDSKKRKSGFTLTEIALVLGVIGSITGAIWWAAGNARETQRGGDAVSELQTVTQNISTLMSGQSFSAGAYPSNYTGNMITAQALPSSYANTATTANTPWIAGNFYVWALSAKSYRISFYQVTNQGCMTLLLQGTACQSGQVGCPIKVGTAGAPAPTAPAHTLTPIATMGWQTVMTSTAADTLCAFNSYTGGTNSVEFDYSF